MTTQQLHLFNALALVIFIVVAILTRATARRIVGATVGAAAAWVAAIPIIALGEKMGWWHFVFPWSPYFSAVLALDCILCGYAFLVTWRIARRWGWHGLAVTAIIAFVMGPIRDYRYMAAFPEWGSYGSGIAPMFAIGVTYLVLGVVGHAVMRLVAGPATADRLARRPWERD